MKYWQHLHTSDPGQLMTLKDLTVLYVDDDAYFRTWMSDALKSSCRRVLVAGNGKEALDLFSRTPPDLVLTDIYMPEMDGLLLTERLRERYPQTPVVLYTAFTDIPLLIRGIELGVAGFVQKPPDLTQLVATLERAAIPVIQRHKLENLESGLLLSMEQILGEGETLRQIGSQACRIAATDYPVLITGETGTGKSRLARIIHGMSRRAKGPLVTVQMGSLPESLVAAELFGHEKGAFTGADQKRTGMVAAADGGTLFLDDVDTTPLSVQALLLQLVEDKTFCRIGSSKPVSADIRIIAASNRNLAADAEAGIFRRDLFYRLAGLVVQLPPLREIAADLPPLAYRFVAEACGEIKRADLAITPEAIRTLTSYPWPGNVRELRNVMKRSAVLAEDAITPEVIMAALGPQQPPFPQRSASGAAVSRAAEEIPLAMAEVEKWAFKRALAAAGGKKMVAARLLQMNYYTFTRHLARLGFDGNDF